MVNNTVSNCHSLELLPTSKIRRYARAGWNVIIRRDDEKGIPSTEIPGSVLVTAEPEGVYFVKKISFRRSDLSSETAEALNALRGSKLVAIYTDERGRRRVCGSPAHPLSLNFSESGGLYEVTLDGLDLYTDSYLA